MWDNAIHVPASSEICFAFRDQTDRGVLSHLLYTAQVLGSMHGVIGIFDTRIELDVHCGSTLVFDVWYSLRVKLCDLCVIKYVQCGTQSMWKRKYVEVCGGMWKYKQSMYKVCGSMWKRKYVGGSAGGAEGESWAALRCRV